MRQVVEVIKREHDRREVWRYSGEIVQRDEVCIVIEAIFSIPDKVFDYITFRQGDRMVEYYYSDRWYNIFELHDVDGDHLKGWYCNFTRPAIFTTDQIIYDDLALDIFIYPDGSYVLLDEPEFDLLPLSEAERAAVRGALDDLLRLVKVAHPPFQVIGGGQG